MRKKSLGVDLATFVSNNRDAVLDGSDEENVNFARKYLGYKQNKGLALAARFNNKYVIREAKSLTDFGGHQNAQFNDALSTVETEGVKAVKVAMLDGVLYIKRL